MEAERVQKERDDLLQTVAGFTSDVTWPSRSVTTLVGRSTTSWARSKKRGT
jgi:hypothetical protein